jgi:riboflavin biosynthesis pyrimidine reductase
MKPHISMLMLTSVDGRLHPSRFTASPDGAVRDWSGQYEKVHDALGAEAWLVGRVTMAEMSKAGPHPPAKPSEVERPIHKANRSARKFAVALDTAGKLHFQRGELSGDHVIVLLGRDVADSHLAELTADGVSYIVADGPDIDIPATLDLLAREFGIKHLVVEGGAGANGAFLAAGVVDEMRILVAPALDGGADVQGVVAYDKGLAGKMQMKLKSADVLEHGVVQLLYSVLPGS